MKLAELYTELTVKGASQFNSQLNVSKRIAQGAGAAFSAAAMASKLILGAGAAIGVFAIKAASDAEEIGSKFKAVFKEEEGDAKSFAAELSNSVGRSVVDVQKMMATFQDTFVPMGFARKEARMFSQEVSKLAIDLASFNNSTDDEALVALQSALVGNHETMRRYGVIINETNLNQELLNMGIAGGKKEATEAQKVQARLNMIMAGTSDAQGDAARTAGGFANQMKALWATIKDTAVMLGVVLMPVAKLAVGMLREMIKTTVDGGNAFEGFTLKIVTAAKYWIRAFAWMETVASNWEVVMSGILDIVQLDFIKLVESLKHWFTQSLPSYLLWFMGAVETTLTNTYNFWKTVFSNMYTSSVTIFKDVINVVAWFGKTVLDIFSEPFGTLGKNIVSFFSNIGGLISGSTNWDSIWMPVGDSLYRAIARAADSMPEILSNFKGLTEGYSKEAFASLPEIADRKATEAEKALSKRIVQGKGMIGAMADRRANELLTKFGLKADPTAAKGAAGAGASAGAAGAGAGVGAGGGVKSGFTGFLEASKQIQEKLSKSNPELTEAKKQTTLQSKLVTEAQRTTEAIFDMSGTVGTIRGGT